MIFATWRQVDGCWRLFIKKDKFWGDREPLEGDEVTVEKKDGTSKTVTLGAMTGSSKSWGWVFEEDEDPVGWQQADHDDYLADVHADEHFACGDKD